MSFKVDVKVGTLPWGTYSAMRFATREEAEIHGHKLSRWNPAITMRVVPSEDAVNVRLGPDYLS
jgi:hypothetical protein